MQIHCAFGQLTEKIKMNQFALALENWFALVANWKTNNSARLESARLNGALGNKQAHWGCCVGGGCPNNEHTVANHLNGSK